LIDRGVHGLYPNGSTGEFPRFMPTERREIVRIVCDQVSGRVPVLAGAAEANVRETIAACEAYHGYGARAVAIVSPFYYKLSPDGVYAYFREIAQQSPIDVTLYNIPMFASPIDVPTLRRLAEECPRVVGIKDSTGDVSLMGRMINAVRPIRPDFSFLTGWDAALVPMLMMGADGGTHASSGVMPEVMRKLYDLTRAGRLEDAVPLQLRVIELFDAMLNASEFPEGFRVGVELRGFEMGEGRQPLSAEQKRSRAALKERLRPLLDGVLASDPPSRQKIEQVTEAVLAALRQRTGR
jgi:4-hydroxy-tetrahydrodipicolinate synthase